MRQRALVVIASGDEVIEVVPQEARERAGFWVPRSIGTRNDHTQGRWAGVMEVGRLEDAHVPRMSTRHAIPMSRSVGGSRAPAMCLVAVSGVSGGTPVGHLSSLLPSRGDGGGPVGSPRPSARARAGPKVRCQAVLVRAPSSRRVTTTSSARWLPQWRSQQANGSSSARGSMPALYSLRAAAGAPLIRPAGAGSR